MHRSALWTSEDLEIWSTRELSRSNVILLLDATMCTYCVLAAVLLVVNCSLVASISVTSTEEVM